jgi:hypothetical protein
MAWCAIPTFWFNQMNGANGYIRERGPWDLEGFIREHQKVMANRASPVQWIIGLGGKKDDNYSSILHRISI